MSERYRDLALPVDRAAAERLRRQLHGRLFASAADSDEPNDPSPAQEIPLTPQSHRSASRRFALLGAVAIVVAGIVGVTAVIASRDDPPAEDRPAPTSSVASTTPSSAAPTATEPPTTTAASTSTSALAGTRENPISGLSGFAGADWSNTKVGPLESAEGIVTSSAPEGRVWIRTKVTVERNAATPGKPSAISEMLQVIGDRSSYPSQPLGGPELELLAAQPDVSNGNTATGYVYFAVDPLDTNLLAAVFGLGQPVFITPGG